MNSQEKAFVFQMNDNGQGPELVRQVFLERGWVEFDEDSFEDHEWNIWWRTSRFRNSDYENIYPWQRLNHYPKSTAITKKDSLARNMKRMKGVYGSAIYNFCPIGFNLPNDYTKYVAEYTRLKEKAAEKDSYTFWICKPADLSRGRGIFIFKDISHLQYDCNAIVQQYITNPLLISGYKLDLRIYVLVTSFSPLHLYIYREGLVRFSTEKYDLNSINNMFAHLTNTSINKHGPAYGLSKEKVGSGCKWTLTQLQNYFRQSNINDSMLWVKIINVVVMTLIVQATQVPKCKSCFEMYGFDILIDDNLKPWLLEVNFSPAMSSDCQTDLVIKKPLLHDLIDLLNLKEDDKDFGGATVKGKKCTAAQGRVLPMSFSGHQFEQSRLKNSRGLGAQLHTLPEIRRGRKLSRTLKDTKREVSPSEFPSVRAGHGLPSVQHQRVSSSSGCSSAGSSHSRDQASSGRHVSTSPDTNQKPTSMPSGRSQMISDIKKRTMSFDAMRRPPQRQLSGKWTPSLISKRDSKNSMHSDSGVSSNSNASDIIEAEPPVKSISLGANRDVSDDGQSATAMRSKKFSVNDSASSSDTSQAYSTHLKHNPSTTNETASQRRGFSSRRRSLERRISSEPCQPTRSNRDMNHQSIQDLHSRTSRPRLTPIHSHSKSSSMPSESRLWDSRSKSNSQSPPDRVGDFILAFPFNEVTRKCANSGSLDPKAIYKECQQLLKDRSACEGIFSCLKDGSVMDSNQGGLQMLWTQVKEVPGLW